jgi:excisionase family DNA binding protein
MLMTVEPLRATEAAQRLGIPTKDLMRLIYDRKIRYVMINGIAHIPLDALEEYLATAS